MIKLRTQHFLLLYSLSRNLSLRVSESSCGCAGSLPFLSFLVLLPPLFSERELMFMFAICRRASVCRLSVTFVHPTQPIEIFGNVSTPFNTLVT